MASRSGKKKKIIAVSVLSVLLAAAVLFVGVPVLRTAVYLKKREPWGPSAQPTAAVTAQTPTEPATTVPVTLPPETSAAAENTTAAPAAAPETDTAAPADIKTEYDIYRSGTFYAVGQVTDSDGNLNPMELAVTADSTYILTSVSGVSLGVLINGDKTYLVSPENKAYLELNSTAMSMLGLSKDDLSASSDIDFSGMKPLKEADSVTDKENRGTPCKEYLFTETDGCKSYFYMDGTRLREAVTYAPDGKEKNRIIFDSLSADVPAEKISPPPEYTKAGILKFIKLMSEDIA